MILLVRIYAYNSQIKKLNIQHNGNDTDSGGDDDCDDNEDDDDDNDGNDGYDDKNGTDNNENIDNSWLITMRIISHRCKEDKKNNDSNNNRTETDHNYLLSQNRRNLCKRCPQPTSL